MKRKEQLEEFRGLDEAGLLEKVRSSEEELMKLTFRNASGQLNETAQLKTLRRQVARAKTVLNQKTNEASAE